MNERRPATTIAELDIHIGYIQEALGELSSAVENMATKTDVQSLRDELAKYATKEDLRQAEARLQRDNVPNVIQRMGSMAKSIMAIFGLISAITLLLWKLAPLFGVHI